MKGSRHDGQGSRRDHVPLRIRRDPGLRPERRGATFADDPDLLDRESTTMITKDLPGDDALSPAQFIEINRICDRFEAAHGRTLIVGDGTNDDTFVRGRIAHDV